MGTRGRTTAVLVSVVALTSASACAAGRELSPQPSPTQPAVVYTPVAPNAPSAIPQLAQPPLTNGYVPPPTFAADANLVDVPTIYGLVDYAANSALANAGLGSHMHVLGQATANCLVLSYVPFTSAHRGEIVDVTLTCH